LWLYRHFTTGSEKTKWRRYTKGLVRFVNAWTGTGKTKHRATTACQIKLLIVITAIFLFRNENGSRLQRNAWSFTVWC